MANAEWEPFPSEAEGARRAARRNGLSGLVSRLSSGRGQAEGPGLYVPFPVFMFPFPDPRYAFLLFWADLSKNAYFNDPPKHINGRIQDQSSTSNPPKSKGHSNPNAKHYDTPGVTRARFTIRPCPQQPASSDVHAELKNRKVGCTYGWHIETHEH